MADRCPVCGSLLEEGVGQTVPYDGKTFTLCSEDCKLVFEQYPEVYAGEQETELDFLEDSKA